MSTVTKWLIVLVVLVAGAWFLWSSGWLNKMLQQPVAQNAQPAASATATRNTPPPTTNGMSQSNDTSDAALAQDSAAIDAQMKAFAGDSSSVDSSMNDKQLPQ